MTGRMSSVTPRPRGIEDPSREPAAYRNLLAPLGIGPQLLDSGHDWVVLEHVGARELWQIGEIEVWTDVAAWVATLHRTLAVEIDRCSGVPLLAYDEALYQLWRERAVANGLASSVIEAHRRATDRLLGLERTVIHGDLYASNLLVEYTESIRVWPIDWELIGMGPAVLDLAALTAGSWSPDARRAMARAYFETVGYPRSESEQFLDLCAARLHLCIQWIGAAPDWTSPPLHSHNWRAEAYEMASEV